MTLNCEHSITKFLKLNDYEIYSRMHADKCKTLHGPTSFPFDVFYPFASLLRSTWQSQLSAQFPGIRHLRVEIWNVFVVDEW